MPGLPPPACPSSHRQHQAPYATFIIDPFESRPGTWVSILHLVIYAQWSIGF